MFPETLFQPSVLRYSLDFMMHFYFYHFYLVEVL